MVKTEKLGPFLGINNRLPRHALATTQDRVSSAYLADAVNVDIDDTGRISTTLGTTLVAPLTNASSVFSAAGKLLLVESGELKRVTALDPFAATTVTTVSGPVRYEEVNGDIYYSDGVKLGVIDSGGTHTVIAHNDESLYLPTSVVQRGTMPAGHILSSIPGRLLSAYDSTLYFSELFNFASSLKVGGYIPFPETISVMIGCGNVIYVVSDKTYVIAGLGTEEITMRTVLPYGAVRFSQSRHPAKQQVQWLSNKGIVVADDQGQAVNVQYETMLLDLTGTGASVFIEASNNRIVATNG